MLKSFKSFYNKDNYEDSKGDVDPFEFHKTFYQFMVNFKVADYKNKHKLTYFNQNLFLFIMCLIAISITFTSLCHGIDTYDIPHITEAGSYTLVLFYELHILRSTRTNLPQYHSLLKALKEDFHYICNEGSKFRKRYFKNQVITWKICIFAVYFTFGIPIGMTIFATISLAVYLITHKAGDLGQRPLPFPFWLPGVDFYASPVYEVALTFAIMGIFLYAYCYIFMIQTQIVWIRQIISKVDIVTWSLQDLLIDVEPASTADEKKYIKNLLQKRIRDIIIHHQSMYSLMDSYATVYKKFLMFEQKFCGPIICLTAYCTAQKLEGEGEFHAILFLLFIATVVLYFIPSYLCTCLAIKVSSICDACWNIPFWNADPVIRPYMVLMMQRSLRRLPLQASGFDDISIETFSKKMTAAYSLFNMLRQLNI